jgi:AGCS family alanine or glycine:cation symporter
MLEQLNMFLGNVSGIVWGAPLLVLLMGTGLILTFRLHFLQIQKLPYALRLAFTKSTTDEPGDISHFQALMTAMAATIGTGNIVGVASAISIGGPGALFWMWVTAVAGMATKYAEAILAVKYRVVDEKGEMSGGPMYYIERGLGWKWLGVLFAFSGAVAALGAGNMVQANAVAGNMKATLGIDPVITGFILAFFTALVILGGVKNIGRVTAWIVPTMAITYALGCSAILLRFAFQIPAALAMVFQGAFSGTAVVGGFVGSTMMLAIRMGVSRGIFSNESGLGSAPIAAAAAKTKEPAKQALVSMTGTFMDTIIICTMTGLVLILTGVWQSGAEFSAMTKNAFSIGLPGSFGGFIVAFGIIFFAYSTILGWAYYGEKCTEYLFGINAVKPYRIAWIFFVAIGAVVRLDLVWNIADILNGFMAIPNLIALLGLSGVVVAETNAFLASLETRKQTPFTDTINKRD